MNYKKEDKEYIGKALLVMKNSDKEEETSEK